MALEQQRLKLSFYDQTGFKGGAEFNYVITGLSTAPALTLPIHTKYFGFPPFIWVHV